MILNKCYYIIDSEYKNWERVPVRTLKENTMDSKHMKNYTTSLSIRKIQTSKCDVTLFWYPGKK